MKNTPLINGHKHQWAEVKIPVYGKLVEGVKEINYCSYKDECGRVKHKASFVVHNFYDISKLLPQGKTLLDIEGIDIKISFIPDGYNNVVEHTLHIVHFTTHDCRAEVRGLIVEKIVYC